MTSVQAKEAEVLAFLKKCEDLIRNRTSVPNFDDMVDKYLGDGEKLEDEVDAMINSKNYSQEMPTLNKLKSGLGQMLDQFEEIPQSPQPEKKPQVTSQPTLAPGAPGPTVTQPLPAPTPAPVVVVAPPPSTVQHPVSQQQAPVASLDASSARFSAAFSPGSAVSSTLPAPQQPVVPNQQVATIPTARPPVLNLKNKSGNEIWQIVKNDNQSINDHVFDTLKALGAITTGFRASFLQDVISATDDLYSYTNFLAPKATPHCLSFKDAAFGSGVGKILHHGTTEPRHLRILTIFGCNNMIGLSGTNIAEIKERVIRVCLVDGERIISNIHTIRVYGTTDPEKHNWIFETTANDSSLSMSFGELFLKCDSKSNNVSVLFECCYVVKRVGTNDVCMVSCGWYVQPLIENNEPVRKGTFDCLLYGGLPMEFNVGLGGANAPPPPAQRPKKTVSLKNSKEPYITFKLAEYNLERELVDTIPDTLIGCTLHLQPFDFYCDSLISMLGKREHPQWAGRIHNPFLSTFPIAADQPDIMDVVRILWVEAFKKLTRQERKDDQLVRTKFISTYLSLAIPAMGSVVLGNKFDWLWTLADQHQMETRRQELGAMLDVLRQNKSPFQLVNINFRPLQPSEYMLDLMSPNCFTVVS